VIYDLGAYRVHTAGDDFFVAPNAAVIGRYCLVGAGALITERKVFADRSLIIGAPARRVRELTDEECRGLEASARHYVERGQQYRRDLKPRPV